VLPDPGDHHVFPDPDPLYVELPEPKGSPTNPYITGRQTAAVALVLVAFAAGVTLLGLAAVRHYEENPSE
jgi:hypothetical protein